MAKKMTMPSTQTIMLILSVLLVIVGTYLKQKAKAQSMEDFSTTEVSTTLL